MLKTFFVIFIYFITSLHAEIVGVKGRGYLEKVHGQKILHVKGTSYEMGYQHGVLLKKEIQKNIEKYIHNQQIAQKQMGSFQDFLPILISYLPYKYVEEMRGLANGAKVRYEDVVIMNLFPEMFHCSAITAKDRSVADGKLYHVRVLDYAVGKGLQESAVIIACQPENCHSFVNISYAGFIGSISGMNDQQISLGEIGGKGYGNWKGMPMSFIMRQILENASTCLDAKAILENTARTCEYFYVVSDGKTKDSFAAYATHEKVEFIEPGDTYKFSAYIAEDMPVKNPFFEKSKEKIDVTQQVSPSVDNKSFIVYQGQLEGTISLMGFNYHPYPILVNRLMENSDQLNVQALIEIIKKPIARKSNLHNVIFSPCDGDFWVANAGENDEAACDQKYYFYNLFQLLQR